MYLFANSKGKYDKRGGRGGEVMLLPPPPLWSFPLELTEGDKARNFFPNFLNNHVFSILTLVVLRVV